MEVMIPDLKVKPILLGKEDLSNIEIETVISPQDEDLDVRADGYWCAYIIKAKKSSNVNINIKLKGDSSSNHLENIWLEINWINYGPFGRIKLKSGFAIPISKPSPSKSLEQNFIKDDS